MTKCNVVPIPWQVWKREIYISDIERRVQWRTKTRKEHIRRTFSALENTFPFLFTVPRRSVYSRHTQKAHLHEGFIHINSHLSSAVWRFPSSSLKINFSADYFQSSSFNFVLCTMHTSREIYAGCFSLTTLLSG